MGRLAIGVRGIRLRNDDSVIASNIIEIDSKILIITANGYGKQTNSEEYVIKGRGGKGLKTAKITEKNGNLIGMCVINNEEDIILTTNKGIMIRISSKDVSTTGRATQGVRLIKLDTNSEVSTITKVDKQ